MYVICNQAPSPSGLPGIDHVTLAGKAQGLKELSVWQQSLAAGAGTPPHRHDCEEVVLCTAGEGRLDIDGGTLRFNANTTLIIPAHMDHQITNIGDRPLETIAVFSSTPVGTKLPDDTPIELPWHS